MGRNRSRTRLGLVLTLCWLVILAACSSPQSESPAPGGGPPPMYTAQQLSQWFNQLNQHIGQVGAFHWGVDEQARRIRIGVGTIEAKARAEEAVRRAGIPAEAVIIELPEGALSEADPLAGCQRPAEKPSDPPGETAYALRVSPALLEPGQELSAVVEGAGLKPLEATRGITADLECWDGTKWSPRFAMFSERGGDEPMTVIYSPNLIVESIGFDAIRPGRFKLPDQLPTGWYRVRMNVSFTEGDKSVQRQLWALVGVQ